VAQSPFLGQSGGQPELILSYGYTTAFPIQHQHTSEVLVQIETTFTGAQSAAAVLVRPYSELGLALPSKRPASAGRVNGFRAGMITMRKPR